jgi:hypothetical protein
MLCCSWLPPVARDDQLVAFPDAGGPQEAARHEPVEPGPNLAHAQAGRFGECPEQSLVQLDRAEDGLSRPLLRRGGVYCMRVNHDDRSCVVDEVLLSTISLWRRLLWFLTC